MRLGPTFIAGRRRREKPWIALCPPIKARRRGGLNTAAAARTMTEIKSGIALASSTGMMFQKREVFAPWPEHMSRFGAG